MSQTSEVGVEETKEGRFAKAFSYMKSHPYYAIGAIIVIIILIVAIYWFMGSKKEGIKKKKANKEDYDDDDEKGGERDKINNLIEEIEDGQKRPPQ